ncbi:hypothetical protein GCM10009127_14960 [Alteraurantiacibacter aestuarii]
MRSLALIAAPVLLLCACSEQEEAESELAIDTSDPLMSGALADQILVDPDMVNRNTGNMAASLAGQDGSVPFPDQGAEAILAARTEAVELVGGNSAMRSAPPATRVDGELPPEAALSVAARAASAGEGNGDCAAQAEFSAIWAARMPQAFPVYPRGAVHEAAGTDASPCALRVVNFTTPVDAGDVMDFYYTRAVADGFSAQRVIQDGDDILGGTRGRASYMVFVRPHPGGGTDVDLVTNGR